MSRKLSVIVSTSYRFFPLCSYIFFPFSFLDTIESCPPEQMFLCQLLQAGRIEDDASKGIIKNVQAALDIRLSSTINLMKNLQETIVAQRAKTESIVLSLRGRLSSEGQKDMKHVSFC